MLSNAEFIQESLRRARAGDVEAAVDVLRFIRSAIGYRQIDSATPEYRELCEYLAECLTAFVDEGCPIDKALHVKRTRRGTPEGKTRTDHTSFAALMFLAERKLGLSANNVQSKILEWYQRNPHYKKPPIEQRSLQQIHVNYEGLARRDDRLLVSFLTAEHRRIFCEFLALQD